MFTYNAQSTPSRMEKTKKTAMMKKRRKKEPGVKGVRELFSILMLALLKEKKRLDESSLRAFSCRVLFFFSSLKHGTILMRVKRDFRR